MFQKTADALSLECPDQPKHKKDRRHRRRHIEVSIAAAQKRPSNMKVSGRIVMAPTDRADAGNESEPVNKQNENENGGEKPKGFADQFAPDDVFQKIVETFDQPFPKILRPARDWFDPASRDLRENDDP